MEKKNRRAPKISDRTTNCSINRDKRCYLPNANHGGNRNDYWNNLFSYRI